MPINKIASKKSESDAARRVRESYIYERRRVDCCLKKKGHEYLPGPYWDGGVTRQGVYRQPIWLSLVEFAAKHEIDAEDLVRYHFAARRLDHPPMPNQVIGARAIDTFHRAMAEQKAESDRLINLEYQYYELALGPVMRDSGWTRTQILGHVLFNESIGISPLMRYCLAVAYGPELHNVASYYCLPASIQFTRRRAALEAWYPIIPDDFIEQAERRYRGYVTEMLQSTTPANSIERQQQM